ncbi:MAG: spermidine synthase-like protein [Proteobacteria bacterium]|nr:spermidine synthase-like protein [Pseudomonadota bacterium]MBU1454166.1 spermidine synthase-like protein [Pseudomonadota bacterium]
MKRDPAPPLQLHLALILLSAALIAFQLEQMQLLAIVQWHHFAYLIISVALLGFGAAGTLIAICRTSLLRQVEWLLPVLMFACAISMAMALPLSQEMTSRFDICLLFIEPGQAALLLLSQGIYLLVFFLGALPLGLVFIGLSSRINSLYCANLVGSGIGGLSAVALMYVLLPQQLPALTALLPWAAGILVISRPRRRSLLALAALTLTLIAAVLSHPPHLQPSQYKDISRTMDLPGSNITASQPSPYGLIELVTAPALRYAPGLSLTYVEEVPTVSAAVFNNGDWFGAVDSGEASFLHATISALPYAMGKRDRVLVLQAGTGTDIIQALKNETEGVMAVEPHQKATTIMAGLYGTTDENLLHHPLVQRSSLTPRTWLALHRERYDLITLPTVGSFGGASGLFALQEQYLLTKEAFLELWNHLSPDGMLRVSAWLDSPTRNSLRLAATIAETLEEADVDARRHVAAVRNWNMITFILKRSPLNNSDIEQVRSFCKRLQFDPALLPELQGPERIRYHVPADPRFFNNLDSLFSPSHRQKLYENYAFNLHPVSDNHPFFSQFLHWHSIPHLMQLFGERTLPFLELGYLIVLISFTQITLAAVLLILLPLLRLGLPGRTGLKRWTIPFFSGLGLGYMFFEIMLIHELVLFFGHPIFAAAAGISGLLVFSGLGSLFSGRLRPHRSNHGLAAALVALLLLLYFFILPPLLQMAITLPPLWKTLFFFLLIAPPATAMGIPFPLGLEHLANHSKSQAAWAWGINGCISVVSTGLATIIAVEFGFSAVMLMACAAYGVAALSTTRQFFPT